MRSVFDGRLGLLLSLTLVGVWADAASPQGTRSATPKAAARSQPRTELVARRLCDALHALPAKRRQTCCGGGASSLAKVCTDELIAAIRRGAVTIQESGVERCEAETEKELTGCSWVTPLLPDLPVACADLVAGHLPNGGACRSSLECSDGLYCRGVSGSQPGVCRPPVPPNAACEFPADNLAAFARAVDDQRHAPCAGRCQKGRCVVLAPAGGPCASSAQCSAGFHCVGGSCEAKPLRGIGELCAASSACKAGTYCHEGKCEPLKEAGAACQAPFECRALACDKVPGATAGRCADACVVKAPRAATLR
jgi:hypothetical protein